MKHRQGRKPLRVVRQPGRACHLRLTPAQVLGNWQQSLYTPAGYLYHLILALRRQGWWLQINNVSEFCRQWEINRRAFYRAKAQLILAGQLEESMDDSINLRIPSDGPEDKGGGLGTVSQVDTTVTEAIWGMSELSQGRSELSQGMSELSQGRSELSQFAPETDASQGIQPPTDLSQISFRSDPREREGGDEIFDPQNSSPETEHFLLDVDFFEWVVTYKIPRLPEKPASPRSVATAWIQKYGTVLHQEYQHWGETATTHQTCPNPPELPPPVQETPAQRLRRYQQLWQNPICRPGIRQAIAHNPDWGLVLGPEGPQENGSGDNDKNTGNHDGIPK